MEAFKGISAYSGLNRCRKGQMKTIYSCRYCAVTNCDEWRLRMQMDKTTISWYYVLVLNHFYSLISFPSLLFLKSLLSPNKLFLLPQIDAETGFLTRVQNFKNPHPPHWRIYSVAKCVHRHKTDGTQHFQSGGGHFSWVSYGGQEKRSWGQTSSKYVCAAIGKLTSTEGSWKLHINVSEGQQS